jgi:hypothetical protein
MAESVSKTTTRDKAAEFAKGLGFLLAFAALYFVGGYVADWMFPASGWATKWRYSLDEDLKDADYAIDKQPHDCEFMSAPMGNKHCHYEKLVATVRIRYDNNNSRWEASIDEGKTWEPAQPGVRRTVVVSWRKVDD